MDVFGFHLAPLDLRQNSEVQSARSPSSRRGRPRPRLPRLKRGRTRRASQERARLRPAARLAVSRLWRGDGGRARGLPRRRRIRARYGQGAIRTSIISKTDSVSDMLELALLLKEVGLVAADGSAALAIVPLFETIADLGNASA